MLYSRVVFSLKILGKNICLIIVGVCFCLYLFKPPYMYCCESWAQNNVFLLFHRWIFLFTSFILCFCYWVLFQEKHSYFTFYIFLGIYGKQQHWNENTNNIEVIYFVIINYLEWICVWFLVQDHHQKWKNKNTKENVTITSL